VNDWNSLDEIVEMLREHRLMQFLIFKERLFSSTLRMIEITNEYRIQFVCAIKSSDHQIIKSSNHQIIRSSDHQIINSSHFPAF